MWPFEKKYSLAGNGILKGWTDWHCHILPGVDDGIQRMQDALAALHYYEETGVEEVWLTPHIMADVPNSTDKLRARFAELQAAYEGPVKLHLAAENMLDSLFEDRLEKNDLLPLADNCLLVETSYFNPPIGFWDLLEEIRHKGYWPVLAHPERYVYMDRKDYQHLLSMDIELQLNLPSVCGVYGRPVQQKALWLLKKGCYRRSGSDLHRLSVTRNAFEREAVSRDILTRIQDLTDR